MHTVYIKLFIGLGTDAPKERAHLPYDDLNCRYLMQIIKRVPNHHRDHCKHM